MPDPSRHALASVAAAISDATIAVWGFKYGYNRPHPNILDPDVAPVVAVPQSPSYPSEHAVTAGAAAAVLSYSFPDQAPKLSDTVYQAAMSRVMAGVAFPCDVLSGLDMGESVGRAAVAYAQQDGSSQQFTDSYPPMPGVWSSTNPVTPLAGSWKPWGLAGASDLRLGPPPAFGSDAASARYAMDKNLNRTNTTNHLAWFWQPEFFQPWLQQVALAGLTAARRVGASQAGLGGALALADDRCILAVRGVCLLKRGPVWTGAQGQMIELPLV